MPKKPNKNFAFSEVEPLKGTSLLKAEMYDFAYKSHSHREYGIAVTRRGIQSFYCENSLYKVSKYGIITFNPEEVHDGYSELKTGLEYQMIYISQVKMQELASQICGDKLSYFHFPDTVQYDYPLALNLLSLFNSISFSNDSCEIETKFYQAVSNLMLKYGVFSQKAVQIRPDNILVDQACQYIIENAAQNISLADIAGKVNLSPYYFSRIFKQVTGLSPHNYLNQQRIEMVKSKILQIDSLAELALKVGFSDQSHMNRRFKEIYGITPGKYRAAISS